MHKPSKMHTIAALVLMLNVSVAPAAIAADVYGQQSIPSAGAMAIDILAVRPLGLAATLLGTGLFVVSLPFSALGGNVGEAADALVKTPAEFTFARPLGEYATY
jgi:hypothetical protein